MPPSAAKAPSRRPLPRICVLRSLPAYQRRAPQRLAPGRTCHLSLSLVGKCSLSTACKALVARRRWKVVQELQFASIAPRVRPVFHLFSKRAGRSGALGESTYILCRVLNTRPPPNCSADFGGRASLVATLGVRDAGALSTWTFWDVSAQGSTHWM
jgi:hypothetical protein